MRAVVILKPGSLAVLSLHTVPVPTLKQGEALICVRACALNRLDIWMRTRYSSGISFPHTPGSDVSGVIEKVEGKSKFHPGDEVVINPAIPCNTCRRCVAGQSCELVKIFGFKTHGGYADFVAVPLDQIYPKPKSLSFVEAAAFPLTFLTAWHMLVTRANLAQGETVFIWGASGGLGTAAIQVARHLGARIIASARSPARAKKLKNIGAHETVVYAQNDVVEQVKKLTHGMGVDAVFESVGAKTWKKSLEMLRPYGRIVIAGTTTGDIAPVDLSDVYVRQLSILGSRMGTKEEFETILILFNKGKLKPVVDSVFPLEKAAEAHKRMEESRHVGKIVLEM